MTRSGFTFPVIVKDNALKMVDPVLLYQIFFVGQDKKDSSTIFNDNYALTLPEGHGRHANYPFSGKLVCAHCGKHYRRRKNTGIIAWQCNTFMTYGKSSYPARQVREEILEQYTAQALGMDHFDAEAFSERIDHILVCDNRILKYMFKDGHAEEYRWQEPSRSAAWTPEKRASVSERRKVG